MFVSFNTLETSVDSILSENSFLIYVVSASWSYGSLVSFVIKVFSSICTFWLYIKDHKIKNKTDNRYLQKWKPRIHSLNTNHLDCLWEVFQLFATDLCTYPGAMVRTLDRTAASYPGGTEMIHLTPLCLDWLVIHAYKLHFLSWLHLQFYVSSHWWHLESSFCAKKRRIVLVCEWDRQSSLI